MASLNLGLSRKNPAQVVALGNIVVGKLAPAAPEPPPIPNMAAKAAALATKTAEAKAANDDYEAGKLTLANLKQIRDQKTDELRLEHTSVAKAVESECKGDPVLLSASGYPLAASTAASGEAPGQIKNFSLTAGDNDGQVDVSFDPDPVAKTYEVQLSTVDPVAGPWITKATPTASTCSITSLTSGQRIWGRARGIGANGSGPWSDPATKIVP